MKDRTLGLMIASLIAVLGTGASVRADFSLPPSAARLMQRSRPQWSLDRFFRKKGNVEYARSEWEMFWWKLPEDFPAGVYYLGVLGVQEDVWKANAPHNWLYHNGERFHLDRWTEPQEAAHGLWMATAFCETPRDFKPGDVIGMRFIVVGHQGLRLVSALPPLSRLHCTSEFPWRRAAPKRWPDADLDVSITPPEGPGSRQAQGRVRVFNYASAPREIDVRWRLQDFYGHPLREGRQSLSIPSLTAEDVAARIAAPAEVSHLQLVAELTDVDGTVRRTRADLVLDRLAGPRPRLYLDGPWDHAFDKSLFIGKPPPADEFRTNAITVPGHMPMKTRDKTLCHIGWCRRSFVPPNRLRQGRAFLCFGNVHYECEVLLNGKNVGRHLGQNAAFEVDVTEALRPGTNELVVAVRDWVAAIDPEELKATPREELVNPDHLRRHVAPIWPSGNRTFGIADRVYLESRAPVYVAEMFVRPSVRQHRLEADVTLANRTAARVTVMPACEVLDRGKTALRIAGEPVRLAPGETRTVTLGAPFPGAPLWWPHDPHLLHARVSLDGSPDVADVRFGFREAWFDGPSLRFNGRVMKVMRGGMRFTRRYSEAQCRQSARALPPYPYRERNPYLVESYGNKPMALHVCDEEGLLLDAHIAEGIGHPTTEKLTSDTYWRNAERMGAGAARSFRNHPCVLTYNLSNEFGCFAPYTNVDDGYEVASRRLYGVTRSVAAIDPTRPAHSDADGDLTGRLPDFNLHYPLAARIFHDTFQGHSFLLPDDVYNWWFADPRGGFQPRTGDKIKLTSNGIPCEWEYGRRPFSAMEVIWYASSEMPLGGTFWLGDHVFLGNGPCWDSEQYRTQLLLKGFRHVGAWATHPWTCGGGADWPPLAAFPIETTRHYYAGSEGVRHVNVHNDRLAPERFTVAWALRGPGGNREQGRREYEFEPGALRREVITFRVPDVAAPTDMELVFRAIWEDREVFREAQPITVFPQERPSVSGAVQLWDPAGATKAALSKLGVTIDALSAVPESPHGNQPLIVGSRALSESNGSEGLKALFAFAEQGGTAVLMRQETWPADAPVALVMDKTRVSSRVWKRWREHPVFEGFPDSWLHDWQPGHVVSSHDFVKPIRGNFISLADSGTEKGLERTCLMELRHGKGRILFCQLRIEEAYGVEPVAPRLLANLVRWAVAAARQPAGELGALQVIAKPRHPLRSLFGAMGVEVIDVPRPVVAGTLRGNRPVLAQLDAGLKPRELQALARFVRDGGFVWLRGADEEALVALETVTGLAWRRGDKVLPCWEGRALIENGAAELGGLSHQEFFWKANVDNGMELPRWKYADLATSRVGPVETGKPEALIHPADLWNVSVGEGRVLVDQVRWAENAGNVNLASTMMRLAGVLLTHAGVKVAPPYSAASQSLPESITWVPVDLSPWANMGFADDQERDGRGGWTDQGPKMDMRTLPTGEQEFNEIPFFLHPTRGCITLEGWHQRGRLPLECRGIKIGRSVLALELLHTGAWVGNGAGVFTLQVNYADGSHVRTPFTGGINTRDWARMPVDPAFPLEIDTLTRLAWRGPHPIFEHVGILQSRWVNPHPDLAVTSIDFVRTRFAASSDRSIRTGEAVATIVGLTLGVAGEGTAKVDPRSAEELLAAATAAHKSGALEEAIRLARALCRKTPKQTENWNLLGDFLLGKGDQCAALKAFKKSLKINWNQPATMEKAEKLEGELR